MKTNPLAELPKIGQSVWYDQMERSLVTEGKLRRLIEEDDLRGMTSNPTIFDKAIGGTKLYDASLHRLAEKGASREEIYEGLVIEDIGSAADVFRPVYDRCGGGDGLVSLEVSPYLANDTAASIAEARRLFERLSRPNVMIKIPATQAGIPAIEESIAAGVNINITLIFARSVYDQVMEAYLRGLERRIEKGLPVQQMVSVASFFVSRIDTMVDKLVEQKIASSSSEAEKAQLSSLLGKMAIANAKVAYQMFRTKFESKRFAALRAKGARLQRPLWASTGTKNPKYSDVLYIDSLIAPDTVNTIPPHTYEAFKDHGIVRVTIEEDLEEAKATLARLEESGISLDSVTDKLTEEGVDAFSKSFGSLLDTIESRRRAEVSS